MKGQITGSVIQTQEWEPLTLVKKRSGTKSKDGAATNTRVLSEEEKIARQKQISPTLRQNIQKARLAQKMTQAQLATASSLAVNTIKELESGTRIFNENEIKKIERALRCKLPRK